MKALPEYPILYRILRPLRTIPGLRRAYYETRSLIHFARNSHLRRLKNGATGTRHRFFQSFLHWSVPIPETVEDLSVHLQDCGLYVEEGAHTLYLPPQEGLREVLGSWVDRYPDDAGFKILKNEGPPDQVKYFTKERTIEGLLTGSALDVFMASCVLDVLGLGPKVYDLAQLSIGSKFYACFINEHIVGDWPEPEAHQQFLDRIRYFIDSGVLALVYPEGLEHADFQEPAKGNLKYDAGRNTTVCIDTQAFLIPNRAGFMQSLLQDGHLILEFGGTPFWRGKNYVYQSLPTIHDSAKRDTSYRWTIIQEMLERADYTLQDHVAFDICCNSGVMLAMALQSGAQWGVGWDLPEVVDQTRKIQKALGFTRLHFIGAELNDQYDLIPDIPDSLEPDLEESCAFFLAGVRHVGWIKSIKDLPWRVLVYEGHEDDNLAETQNVLADMARQWNATITEIRQISDGDCDRRPLAVLKRS